MQALIGNYNYYMQMIRDVTGLNEARDGSTPDKNALVGVQKLAAANSNTATRHILQAGLFLIHSGVERNSEKIIEEQEKEINIIDAYDQDPEAAQKPQRRAGADRAS